jgi:transcriptional regulator with XRE-family HTH domain
MNFAEHLMSLRRQRGWSQEELGNQVGVTRQTVSKWEMGQSTPELEKLVELARLFNMSIDRLVGLEGAEERGGGFTYQQTRAEMRSLGVYYEYISPIKVFGLPLVHIRLGFGPRLAKGIVAIGNCAVGVVAVGGCSLGLVSLGGLTLGLLLAFGGLSLGLVALGGVAIGGFAVGGCAIGQWLAIGGGAFSNYLAIGGGAWSRGVAIGGSAYGHVAVGINEAQGAFPYLQKYGYHIEDVWYAVKSEFPHMWSWVRDVIQWALG